MVSKSRFYGLLCDDIDRAAGRAAPREGRGRAAQDFDLLRKEVLAHAHARVADAVDKISFRASKPRMKKRSPKAFPPSPEPSVTPAVVRPISRKRRGVLVVQRLSGDNGYRLGRIDDRLSEFARRKPVAL